MATHPEEHNLIYEPDQAKRAQELLLWQQSDKARLIAFVRALAAGAQLAENTTWAVIVGSTTLAGSEGVNLERWGDVVGEVRGGLTNQEEYRKFINLRVRVNSEAPSEDAMWAVLDAAVDPSIVTSHYVADGIVYQVASLDWTDDAQAAHAGALIRDFRPTGTYAGVMEYVPDHFALDWEANAPVIAGLSSPGTAVVSRLIYDGRSRG